MTFILGPVAEVSKTTGQALSVHTIKAYSAALNKLAKKGFETPEKIMNDPNGTVAAINDILSGQPSPKFRVMYCAVFWALSATDYCSKPNPLFTGFVPHKHVPGQP
jgi:hypothetical protein